MTPADQVATWPVERAAWAIVTTSGSDIGGARASFELASVSKLLAGLTALIAVEEGSLDLDEAAGPDGSTVRHLLAHASGLDFDSDRVLAAPGSRRIYSNTGIERYADHLADRTGMPYAEYLQAGVLDQLGMADTELYGSPAHEMRSTIGDIARLAEELVAPTLVSSATLEMARRPVFEELAGVLPGIGRFDPNPFGLAMEVKGAKHPHWTGTLTSPETFGHFGGAGTFLWVDPSIGVGAVGLTNRGFGPWAMDAWGEFSDLVVASGR